MENYTTILRQYNLKATPQRLAIIKSINDFGHINIDKLYEEVKQRFSSISLATIYKNINAMIQNMLLVEVKIPNKKSVYEIVKQEHSHLVCQKCSKVLDIEIDTNTIVNLISKEYDFSINQSNLVLSGICKDCKNKI
jgi:Fur family peroxide stress response transcriptional regulator